MRLLYITNGISGPGGLERVLSIKASHLAEDYAYEVHILTLNGMSTKPFYEFSNVINFHNIIAKGNPIKYLRAYISGINEVVREINPTIISVCDDGLKGFFAPILINTSTPILYERHASIVLKNKGGIKSFIYEKIMQRLARRFSRFIVLSPSNKMEWHAQNVQVIPNPLSFFPIKRSTLSNKKVIVVGTHSYNKGYDLLMGVWQQVILSHPDWTLHVYGKIDSDQQFVNLAKKMNLLQSVFFHHPEKNIEQCFLDSSIMLLPSRSEGFGMVLIEAMACGLPCISFDCPAGPKDIISDEINGFLIPPKDTEAMAIKLMHLMKNKDRRHQIGIKARDSIKKYLPEVIIAKWDTLIKQVIQ